MPSPGSLCPSSVLAAATQAWASRCTRPHPPAHRTRAPPRWRPAAGENGVRRADPSQDPGRDQRGGSGQEGSGLTHFISRSVKMRVSTTMRRGTVRMRMKGKASEASVDMTAHSRARQSSCRAVNRCIRRVRTCGGQGGMRRGSPSQGTPGPATSRGRLTPFLPTGRRQKCLLGCTQSLVCTDRMVAGQSGQMGAGG